MTRRVNLIFVPMMASRLMLSLKKAATQPKQLWSLDTMATISGGRTLESVASYSAQRMHRGLHGTSQTPSALDEEDVELNAVGLESSRLLMAAPRPFMVMPMTVGGVGGRKG